MFVVDLTELFRFKKHEKHSELKQILHISCFENRSKNLTGLLDALYEVRKKRNDFQCVIAGSSDEFDMIYQYAKEKNMLDYIQFPGYISAKEISELMNTSDFYLQTSHYETLSVVVAEALCSGLPVLSTAVGAIPEIVNRSNGILVQDNNHEELVAAIDLMLDNYINYPVEGISKNAINQFSTSSILERFNNFYIPVIRKEKE